MTYYAVAERRVLPGRMAAFVEATRRIGEHLAADRRQQSEFNLYVDERDPDAALLVGSWVDPEAFAIAQAALPPELVGASRAHLADSPGGQWRWYRSIREVLTFVHRPAVVAAHRCRVRPKDMAALSRWLRPAQDAAMDLPGVVSTRVLEARDQPGELLYLGEYRDGAALAQVDLLQARTPPPIPLHDRRRFVGSIGYSWERPHPLP